MSEQTYWMPESLPSPTEEYQDSQRNKKYLTPEGEERFHPKWTYENTAYVDDQYLLKNEGWRLIIDNYPFDVDDAFHKIERLPVSEWISTSSTITVRYDVYQIRDASYPSVLAFDKTYVIDDHENWTVDRSNKIITKTFKIISLNQDEIDRKKESIWNSLREHRNRKLQETDIIILCGLEDGKTISEEMKTYRQELRDFPATISDITKIDGPETRLENESIWPVKPSTENYYS
jgi:hypothetical protein